jgi:hypothetical protein
MSTEVNDTWTLGETWSEVITCTDEDGNVLNPVSADYKIKSLDGLIVSSPTPSIVGNVVTVTIPTTDQGTITSRVYRRRLKVTDSGGAISRQVHGLITVWPADDD